MDYTELVKDTDRLIQRVMLHQVIGEWLLMIAVVAMVVFLVILALEDHWDRKRIRKARKARMAQPSAPLGEHYEPTAQETWVDENGVTFTRYGTPAERRR